MKPRRGDTWRRTKADRTQFGVANEGWNVGNVSCKQNQSYESALDYLLESANDYDLKFFGNLVEVSNGTGSRAEGGAGNCGGGFDGKNVACWRMVADEVYSMRGGKHLCNTTQQVLEAIPRFVFPSFLLSMACDHDKR